MLAEQERQEGGQIRTNYDQAVGLRGILGNGGVASWVEGWRHASSHGSREGRRSRARQ